MKELDLLEYAPQTSQLYIIIGRTRESNSFKRVLTLFGLGAGGGGGKCPRRFQLSRTSLIFKQYLPNMATFNIFCNLINVARDLLRQRYCAIPFFEIEDGGMYFALYQNLKLFLVRLFWKTLQTELKRF